jgi:dUTP pyrophosphatase
MIEVKVKKLHPQAVIPAYMTEHAAGMDLCTVIDAPVVLNPGELEEGSFPGQLSGNH